MYTNQYNIKKNDDQRSSNKLKNGLMNVTLKEYFGQKHSSVTPKQIHFLQHSIEMESERKIRNGYMDIVTSIANKYSNRNSVRGSMNIQNNFQEKKEQK